LIAITPNDKYEKSFVSTTSAKSDFDLVVMVRRAAEIDHVLYQDGLSKLFSRVET